MPNVSPAPCGEHITFLQAVSCTVHAPSEDQSIPLGFLIGALLALKLCRKKLPVVMTTVITVPAL